MAEFDIRSIKNRAPGDQFSDAIERAATAAEKFTGHPMDSPQAHDELRKLLQWFYHERDKQATNRLEMALDEDFYDSMQWDPDDAAILEARGQMPLVYNEVAPIVDWLIGTERRMRVDWSVLPRTDDDVQSADIKTKVMKYISDVNKLQFARSRSFSDAVKVGVGWMDDGVRDDPTKDAIYSRYENWRNVLWDSSGYELDLSDARYVFRWRWVDEDVAAMIVPSRADRILRAVEDYNAYSLNDDEAWYLGERVETGSAIYGGSYGALGVDASRRRVKLIECQYRKPAKVRIVTTGPMRGAIWDERDQVMEQAILAHGGAGIVDKIMMRVHFAVFTEADMLAYGPSIYRHNSFTLTPTWCYRRGRDRLPYGVIRRVRDIQMDLNKRASKALFMLNTNQVIADKGAVDDQNKAMDEVSRPDGYIEKAAGKEFTIRRDTDAATGQMQIMTMDAQTIQKSVGISPENLGRQTNAESGVAIERRQDQGSISTTEPFDNQLLSIEVQGQKILSMAEQFYTEEKVIRLTGAKGKLEWVRINQPERQPDGSVRYLNDITSSMADFIVSERDYTSTLRQVMFESMNQLVQKLPPEIGLKLYAMAMDYSDLPNADEIASEIRRMIGERDPNKPMSPEEAAEQEQRMQEQLAVMQQQRDMASAALEEQRAKVAKLNAEAARIMAETQTMGQPGGEDAIQRAVMDVQAQAADQIDALTQELRKVQSEVANKAMAIKSDADVRMETARIDADAKVRVAEIQGNNDAKINALQSSLDDLAKQLNDVVSEYAKRDEEAKAIKAEPDEKPEKEPAQPINLNLAVNVDAGKGEVKKSISIKTDKDGNITGADVVPDGGDEGDNK